MKDIYELFNDVEVDVSEVEKVEVNDVDKQKVKNHLKQITKKKKRVTMGKRILTSIAAAAALVLALGFAFPAYASNIPFVGSIFKVVDENKFADYQEFSHGIGLVQKDNGISITIDEAVYDGNTVTLTYFIESDRALGDSISTSTSAYGLNDHVVEGGTNKEQIKKIGDHQYVGVSEFMIPTLEDWEEDIHFYWHIGEVVKNPAYREDEQVTKGKWHFAFSIKATDVKEYVVDKSVYDEGVEFTISRVVVSPISTKIYYDYNFSSALTDEWEHLSVSYDILDDLDASFGYESWSWPKSDDCAFSMEGWVRQVGNGHNDRKQLIIKPVAELDTYRVVEEGIDDEGHAYQYKETDKMEFVELDEIVIDLK